MKTAVYKVEPVRTYPGYPWQTVEGEGQTWIILRAKKRFDFVEIESIEAARVTEFEWSIKESEVRRDLYGGHIEVEVCYRGSHQDDKRSEFKASDEDESLCRELLFSDCHPVLPVNRYALPSVFPSILFQREELLEKKLPQSCDYKNFRFNLPWQAWLNGSGAGVQPALNENGAKTQPILEMVHISQIGLSSLLVEVLIKIETPALNIALVCAKKEQFYVLPQEKWVFTLKDENIHKAIGVALRRGLISFCCDLEKPGLVLESIKELSIIYLSAGKNERILVARHICPERIALAGCPPSQVEPASFCFNCHSRSIALISPEKIMYRENCLCALQYDPYPEKKADSSPGDQETAERPEAEKKIFTMPKRSRPGERWQKKGGRKEKAPPRAVLKVKLAGR